MYIYHRFELGVFNNNITSQEEAIMDKETALKIWNSMFGKNSLWETDCYGTWIYRDDYGDIETKRIRPGNTKQYSYGWEVDHIRPKSSFKDENDADFLNNYELVHWENNRTKADQTTFEINGEKYEVITCDICKKAGKLGYGIKSKTSSKRVDWKGRTNNYFIK